MSPLNIPQVLGQIAAEVIKFNFGAHLATILPHANARIKHLQEWQAVVLRFECDHLCLGRLLFRAGRARIHSRKADVLSTLCSTPGLLESRHLFIEVGRKSGNGLFELDRGDLLEIMIRVYVELFLRVAEGI